MENLKIEDFEIDVHLEDPASIHWLGICQFRKPTTRITPYIEKLADSLRGKTVVVDFQKLKFMNSSAVYPVIQLCQIFDDNEIRTRILYDSNSGWQKASFKALESLASMLEYISVEGKSKELH